MYKNLKKSKYNLIVESLAKGLSIEILKHSDTYDENPQYTYEKKNIYLSLHGQKKKTSKGQIDSKLAEISYFEPSEFKKGEI